MSPEMSISYLDFQDRKGKYIPENTFVYQIDGEVVFLGDAFGVRVEVPGDLHPVIKLLQKNEQGNPKDAILCTKLELKADSHGSIRDGHINRTREHVVVKGKKPFPLLVARAPLD